MIPAKELHGVKGRVYDIKYTFMKILSIMHSTNTSSKNLRSHASPSSAACRELLTSSRNSSEAKMQYEETKHQKLKRA
jgi:hypothetical protein